MSGLEAFRKIHLIGIGGAGMSAIADILLNEGFIVSGSDVVENAVTARLAARGARIQRGHQAEALGEAELVVTSSAIGPDNPERAAAERMGRPLWHRSRVLAAIMDRGRSVAVSGTHGKTTTTSMLGLMLIRAGMDPTVLVGGELNDFGGNARPGHGLWTVAEADESDGSLLVMAPDRILVSNLEADHLDYYADLDAICRTFERFFARLKPGGSIIACTDCPNVAALVERVEAPVVTYGLSGAEPEMTAERIRSHHHGNGVTFMPRWRGQALPEIRLRVAGRHNVLNALGALACALEIGAPFEPLSQALGEFTGARRRYQLTGVQGGITIIDDYAHHPSELRATLAVAREQVCCNGTGRLVGVFQPHRYSRTRAMADRFGEALCESDLLVVTDVYGAGEAPLEGVSGELIWQAARAHGHRAAHYTPTLEQARSFLTDHLAAGDRLLTLGAGNVWQVGQWVLEDLRGRLKRTSIGLP